MSERATVLAAILAGMGWDLRNTADRACPYCNSLVTAESNFCSNCGHSLAYLDNDAIQDLDKALTQLEAMQS